MTKLQWIKDKLVKNSDLSVAQLVQAYDREVGGKLSPASVFRAKVEMRASGVKIPKQATGRKTRKAHTPQNPARVNTRGAETARFKDQEQPGNTLQTPLRPVQQSLELIEAGLDRLIVMAMDISASEAMLQPLRRARRVVSAEILNYEEADE